MLKIQHYKGIFRLFLILCFVSILGCRVDKYKLLKDPQILASVDPDVRFLVIGEEKFQIVAADGTWSKGQPVNKLGTALDKAFPVYKKFAGIPGQYSHFSNPPPPPIGLFAFDPLRQMTGIITFPTFPEELTVAPRSKAAYPPIKFVTDKQEYDLVDSLQGDYWLTWPVFAFDATRMALYGVSISSSSRDNDKILVIDRISGNIRAAQPLAGCGGPMFGRYVSHVVFSETSSVNGSSLTAIVPASSSVVFIKDSPEQITRVTMQNDRVLCEADPSANSVPRYDEEYVEYVYNSGEIVAIEEGWYDLLIGKSNYQFSLDGSYLLEWDSDSKTMRQHSFALDSTEPVLLHSKVEDVTKYLDTQE